MTQAKLDKKKLESYKKMLLELKDNLVHDINNMAKNPIAEDGKSGDVSGHVLHMADVATDMYDKEFNLSLASNEREVLHQIDQALKRIEDKAYGKCIECGKQIRIARLKAIPYVENCVQCQEKIENGK